MILRDARTEELDAVAETILAAYRQYAPLMPERAWEAYARDIVDVRGRLATSELIVADVDGRLLGAVTFYPNTPSDEASGGSEDGGEGWPPGYSGIRLLAVHPEARGLGLGRKLTEECIRRSRVLGRHHMALHTTEFMAVAKAMYERMGFERWPEHDFTPARGIVIMAYRLAL